VSPAGTACARSPAPLPSASFSRSAPSGSLTLGYADAAPELHRRRGMSGVSPTGALPPGRLASAGWLADERVWEATGVSRVIMSIHGTRVRPGSLSGDPICIDARMIPNFPFKEAR
jgi:hypothetical protein